MSGFVSMTVQVPTDLADKVKQLAEAADRSAAAEVRLALRAYVAEAEKAAA